MGCILTSEKRVRFLTFLFELTKLEQELLTGVLTLNL